MNPNRPTITEKEQSKYVKYIYIYMYVYIYIYMYVYIYIYMYVCMYVCMYICMYAFSLIFLFLYFTYLLCSFSVIVGQPQLAFEFYKNGED